jgi:CRP/FNR family transcriptional regulator, cyclic AMP receptor protein
MPTPAEFLATVPLFEGLADNERALLAERVDIMELKEGAKLFDYGDPGDWMAILKSGVVELSVKTKTGEKVFLERAEAGDFFGEISLLDLGPRTAAATVLEAGEAIIVDRGDLDELLAIAPRAALKLLTATGKRLRWTQTVLRNTATRNVNDAQEAATENSLVLRVADWVANFSGSITFLVLHIVLFTVWIVLNVGVVSFGDFDPFPFGLLTMAVSLEAIILSTLLLFSSNRQTARDRVRSDIEYEVNLKAELQISQLHEKIDQLHAQLLGRLDALDPNKKPPHLAAKQ